MCAGLSLSLADVTVSQNGEFSDQGVLAQAPCISIGAGLELHGRFFGAAGAKILEIDQKGGHVSHNLVR